MVRVDIILEWMFLLLRLSLCTSSEWHKQTTSSTAELQLFPCPSKRKKKSTPSSTWQVGKWTASHQFHLAIAGESGIASAFSLNRRSCLRGTAGSRGLFYCQSSFTHVLWLSPVKVNKCILNIHTDTLKLHSSHFCHLCSIVSDTSCNFITRNFDFLTTLLDSPFWSSVSKLFPFEVGKFQMLYLSPQQSVDKRTIWHSFGI